jgi:uncharacterized protein (TIGR02118 family)
MNVPAANITWYCEFVAGGGFSPPDVSDVTAISESLATLAGLSQVNVHTPAVAHDPYSDDGPGPLLVLELDFVNLAAIETNLRADGPLAALFEAPCFSGLRGARRGQQSLLTRRYAVPEPPIPSRTQTLCTFLVSYPGPADDERAWHEHYVSHHAPIMVTFPGVRAVSIHTPAVVVCGLEIPLSPAMQRNKVVFDSPGALSAALASPVREAMRKDFEKFPAFQGGNQHFAMRTISLSGPNKR